VLFLVSPEIVSEYIDDNKIISQAIKGYPRPLYALLGKAIKGKISRETVIMLKSNREIFNRLYRKKDLEYLSLYLAIVSKDFHEVKIAYNALREILSEKICDIIYSIREYFEVLEFVNQGALNELFKKKKDYKLFEITQTSVTIKLSDLNMILNIRPDILVKALIAIHIAGLNDVVAFPSIMKEYVELAEKLIDEKHKVVILLNGIYAISSISLGLLTSFLSMGKLPLLSSIVLGISTGIIIQIIENLVIPFTRIWLSEKLSIRW